MKCFGSPQELQFCYFTRLGRRSVGWSVVDDVGGCIYLHKHFPSCGFCLLVARRYRNKNLCAA